MPIPPGTAKDENVNPSTSVTVVLSDFANSSNDERVWEILKEYSAKKYWRDVKFVNEEIIARLWFATDDDEDEEFDDS